MGQRVPGESLPEEGADSQSLKIAPGGAMGLEMLDTEPTFEGSG